MTKINLILIWFILLLNKAYCQDKPCLKVCLYSSLNESKSKVIIKERDLKYYNWKTHSLVLKCNKKIRTYKFDSFKIILKGEILYAGKLEGVHLATIAVTSPSILIAKKRIVIDPNNGIMIWYHGGTKDPRENEDLLNFLKTNNFYRE